jgi:lysophospholipase L1-like esterase
MLKKLFFNSVICIALLPLSFIAQAEELDLKSVAATDVNIALLGRVDKQSDGSARFAYPGVSFSLNTHAASLSMLASSNSGNAWVDVIVDGGEPKTIQLGQASQNYELFHFTTTSNHSVRITNRTETWQAISTIKSFQLQGELLAAPSLAKRKILVLGDSVTCGEMIDRVAGEKPNSRWSNARESYGLLTAEALHAQVHLVCMGGRGLIRSWNGKTDEHNLPDFYQYTIASDQDPVMWDHTQYDPDVIISAIGTNDFSPGIPDRETYVNTYVKLLLTLLSNHKHAQILLTEGAILDGDKKTALMNYIAETVKRVDDKRVHIAKSTHYPGDKTDAHPTKEQHSAMAKDLVPQVKAIMRW